MVKNHKTLSKLLIAAVSIATVLLPTMGALAKSMI
jgi:hypothetical protein